MSQQKALVSSEVHNMDRSMRKVSMVWKMHEKINYSPAQNVHNLTPPPKKTPRNQNQETGAFFRALT